jgi:hypothetical protein
LMAKGVAQGTWTLAGITRTTYKSFQIVGDRGFNLTDIFHCTLSYIL